MRGILIYTLSILILVVLSYSSDTQAMMMGAHKLFGEAGNEEEATDSSTIRAHDEKRSQSIKAIDAADLNNDGSSEIILLHSDSVNIINAHGTIIKSFPILFSHPAHTPTKEKHFKETTLLTVAALTGDGKMEILISDGIDILVLDSSGEHIFSLLP